MPRKISLIFFLTAVAINAIRAEIDFTPAIREYTAEGFAHRELTLKRDKGQILFSPPANWNVRGEKDRLRLSPAGKDFVEASIQGIASPAGLEFDESTLTALEQQVVKEIPPGAQSIQVVDRRANSVVIGSNPTFEFLLSYQALGQHFQKSVVFVNGPDRLILRLTAPKAEFARFAAEFRQSIFSWQWIEVPSAKTAMQSQPQTSITR